MSRPLPDLRDVAYWIIFLAFSVISTYILVTLTQLTYDAEEQATIANIQESSAILLRRKSEDMVLYTTAGQVQLSLDRKGAPKRVARLVALAEDGGFDGVPFMLGKGYACAGLEKDDEVVRSAWPAGTVSTGEDGGAICIVLSTDDAMSAEGFEAVGTVQSGVDALVGAELDVLAGEEPPVLERAVAE
jgi:hypothetical protein